MVVPWLYYDVKVVTIDIAPFFRLAIISLAVGSRTSGIGVAMGEKESAGFGEITPENWSFSSRDLLPAVARR